MNRLTGVALALALDLIGGEPPTLVHPVVWLGRLTSWLESWARREPPVVALVGGAGIVASVATFGYLMGRTPSLLGRHRVAAGALEVYLLKSAFSLRALRMAANRVATALETSDLEEARRGLRWLVSRPTAELQNGQVAAAAIESVTENASDSFVAPLLYYAIGGLPAALTYRAINTMDAMIGYRGEYEHLGKVAAHLDDVANWLPARGTAVLLALAAQLRLGSGPAATRAWWRFRGATASPNAGHPMSVASGALGADLEKPDHYRLGDFGREPAAADVRRAVTLVDTAAVLAVALVACYVRRGKKS